jgi:hypothetical protein
VTKNVTTSWLPGWITRVDFVPLPFETVNSALVEAGSLIKTGASSGKALARATLNKHIKQAAQHSMKNRSRRQAS